MTDNAPSFRSVMRGYDPAQVDTHLGELLSALDDARREATDRTDELSRTRAAHADLSAEADDLRAQARSLEDAQRSAGQPTFTDLGARVGQILQLAEDEATERRAEAEVDAADLRAAAVAAAETVRAEATRSGDEVLIRAQADAASRLESASRRADEMVDEAERAAHTRREEGEAVYESQRVKAAASAADLETTLAERRDKAAAEFAAQLATHDQQLTEARSRAEAVAAESQQLHLDATQEADRLLQVARAEAAALTTAARDQAERVRAESERELAAATDRRDSINRQLANVRQMLSTLGGSDLTAETDDLGRSAEAH